MLLYKRNNHTTMNLAGTYKVNIEQTVRKLGESEDRQIDALVYDRYALTPAEMKIVEGTN